MGWVMEWVCLVSDAVKSVWRSWEDAAVQNAQVHLVLDLF